MAFDEACYMAIAPICTEHVPGRAARNLGSLDRARRSVDLGSSVISLGLEFSRCIGRRDSEGKSESRKKQERRRPRGLVRSSCAWLCPFDKSGVDLGFSAIKGGFYPLLTWSLGYG